MEISFKSAPAKWLTLVTFGSLSTYILINLSLVSSSRAGIFNYHMYLAEAFLNGSLSLVRSPPTSYDLSLYNGKLYLYWGPMPAICLMPLVYIFGADWSDAWLTIALATLNCAACFFLLNSTKSLHGLTPLKILLLTAAYGFGSPLTPLAFDGTVWFVGQLFANLFLLLAVGLTLHPISERSWYLLPATLFAMGCLTRSSMAGSVLWFLWFLYSRQRSAQRSALLSVRALMPALGVLAIFFLGLLWYNFARFGDPFDLGISYHKAGQSIQADIDSYGLFSLHYLLKNFYYHYLAYPYPAANDSLMGGSLFLMTPLYLGAFFAKNIEDRQITNQLYLLGSFWIAIALLALPSLLVCGTGWSQIGPRYTLDYAPFLLLLVAIGIRGWPGWVVALSALASIVQYIYGVMIFT